MIIKWSDINLILLKCRIVTTLYLLTNHHLLMINNIVIIMTSYYHSNYYYYHLHSFVQLIFLNKTNRHRSVPSSNYSCTHVNFHSWLFQKSYNSVTIFKLVVNFLVHFLLLFSLISVLNHVLQFFYILIASFLCFHHSCMENHWIL